MEGGRVHVENLLREPISSLADAHRLIAIGTTNRTSAATTSNAESSRSHAVLTLRLTAELRGADGVKRQRVTSLHLVDLAGSERQKDSQSSGVRLREACCINKSLSALGNVISALSTAAATAATAAGGATPVQRHVPYRDSKLTLLLRDALGGDAKTAVIATVSPSDKCFA